MLGVRPEFAVVIEDAISGVQAGARGRFGLVIGVDRKGNAEELKANGAQFVVSDLAELLTWDFTQPLRPAA
jgi:beta-phosphoglucomutase-like phosphatase (HAD superfamily)